MSPGDVGGTALSASGFTGGDGSAGWAGNDVGIGLVGGRFDVLDFTFERRR